MRPLLVFATICSATGCFYDSAWGHETSAQKHNAEAARPASFKGPVEGSAKQKAAKPFKIRVWATPRFASQTLDWKHEFRGVVDDANDVLATVGARLEVAGIETWSTGEDDDLEKAIVALKASDQGADVAWVFGLVGSFSKFTLSFHELGMTNLLGHHIVLRAAGDLNDHAFAEQAFTKLSPDERLRVVAERKRHRSVSALVHEIGHTMGAVHDTNKDGLMFPGYGKTMRGFGPEVTTAIGIGIAHQGDEDGHVAFGKELLAFYEKSAMPWEPKERDELMAFLRKHLTPKPAAAPATAPTKESAPEPLAFTETPTELAEKDRATWARAVESFRAKKWSEAWDAGAPLFAAYPKTFAVQDMRCQLSTKLHEWQRTKLECAPLMKLSTGK